ncbi:MAG: hypothetical protein Q9173_004930 [Seirophora scorigena]
MIPLGSLCCIHLFALDPFSHRIPIVILIYAVLEIVFLLFVFLPRYFLLQSEGLHPPPPSKDERQRLFRLCIESISDPERYLSKWFKGAHPSEIRRENIKQFFCWAFLNKRDYGLLEDQELEDYTDQLQALLGRELPSGKGDAVALRLTLDKVQMLYRPLIWYLLTALLQMVLLIDTLTHLYMRYHSFHFYRLAMREFLTVFPPRPLSLMTTRITPAKTTSYWHHPHTSKSRLPTVFIHGIGIGLWTYAGFLAALSRLQGEQVDGETGVIAIEIMPISCRLTKTALNREEMKNEILKIVRSHGWSRFVLVAHSYGSVVATHLLRDVETSRMIDALLLVDPVSVLLHLPDVAYNFTCRKPGGANEQQLYYFASMDAGVAHTLARGFFWQENILWKQDLQDRRATVALCGRDLIVNTEAVGNYLARDEGHDATGSTWKTKYWHGHGLDVIWYEDLDHAQVFERKQDYAELVKVLQHYTSTASALVSNGK